MKNTEGAGSGSGQQRSTPATPDATKNGGSNKGKNREQASACSPGGGPMEMLKCSKCTFDNGCFADACAMCGNVLSVGVDLYKDGVRKRKVTSPCKKCQLWSRDPTRRPDNIDGENKSRLCACPEGSETELNMKREQRSKVVKRKGQHFTMGNTSRWATLDGGQHFTMGNT
jgi:hypothetical protein